MIKPKNRNVILFLTDYFHSVSSVFHTVQFDVTIWEDAFVVKTRNLSIDIWVSIDYPDSFASNSSKIEYTKRSAGEVTIRLILADYFLGVYTNYEFDWSRKLWVDEIGILLWVSERVAYTYFDKIFDKIFDKYIKVFTFDDDSIQKILENDNTAGKRDFIQKTLDQ